MAQLQINGNVRIGHIYECEFGLYKKINGGNTAKKEEAVINDYDYRIPNEMVKKRAVVVVGKHGGGYLVVPISSTKETAKKKDKEPEAKGFHIKLSTEDFPETERYLSSTERWAKSNLVTSIDGGRLRDIYDKKTRKYIAAHKISDETLKKVREGIVISIGMNDLLDKTPKVNQLTTNTHTVDQI